ncbi:MAG: hypothetical protein U5R30_21650 [Deltaproteobacteria bacterium]|nr:hypothetical protein [Deltaproteobacteria bacterium]
MLPYLTVFRCNHRRLSGKLVVDDPDGFEADFKLLNVAMDRRGITNQFAVIDANELPIVVAFMYDLSSGLIRGIGDNPDEPRPKTPGRRSNSSCGTAALRGRQSPCGQAPSFVINLSLQQFRDRLFARTR